MNDKYITRPPRLRKITCIALSIAMMLGSLPAFADEAMIAPTPAASETPIAESTPTQQPTETPAQTTAAPAATQPADSTDSAESQPVEPAKSSPSPTVQAERQYAVSANVVFANNQDYQLIAPGTAYTANLKNTGTYFASDTVLTLSGTGLSVSPQSVKLNGTQSAAFSVSANSDGIYTATLTAKDAYGTQIYSRELLFICAQDRSNFAIPLISGDLFGNSIKKIDYIRADDPSTKLELNSRLLPYGSKAAWSISNTTGEGNATIKLTSTGTSQMPPILYTKSNIANVQATLSLTLTLPAGETLVRYIPINYEVRPQVPKAFKTTGDIAVAAVGALTSVDLTTKESGSALSAGMSVTATLNGVTNGAQLTTTTFTPDGGFAIGCTKPGIYTVTITAVSDVPGLIDGGVFSKEVCLIVADAYNQLPDGLFEITPSSLNSTIYSNTSTLGSARIKYNSPITADASFSTVWQITDASGKSCNIAADTSSDSRGNSVTFKPTGALTSGTYNVTATVNFRGSIKTLTVPLTLTASAPGIFGLLGSYSVPYSYTEYVISAPAVMVESSEENWQAYSGKVTWSCKPNGDSSVSAFASITTDPNTGYTRFVLPSNRVPGEYSFIFTAMLGDGRTATKTFNMRVLNVNGIIPTPEPTLDPTKPRQGIVDASKLNVRATPSDSGRVLGQLRSGAEVEVTDWSGTWYAIKYNGATAYVMGAFIKFKPTATPTPTSTAATPTPTATLAPTAAPTLPGEWGIVNLSSGTLRVRESANSSAKIIANLPKNTVVEILGTERTWYKIKSGLITGYVSQSFIKPTSAPTASPEATQKPTATPISTPTTKPSPTPTAGTAQYGTVTLSSSSSRLIIRKEPSGSASILTRLKHGTKVEILGASGDYYKVKFDNDADDIGYASKVYIKLNSSVATPTATSTAKPTPTPTSSGSTYYATVITADGTGIYLRETQEGAPLRTIPYYGVVEVLHVYGQWSHVSYEGTQGYVYNKYLKKGIYSQDNNDYPKARIVLSSSASMNIRESASSSSSVVGSVPNGAIVDMMTTTGEWRKIRYNGIVGYCQLKYLNVLG